LKKFFPAKTIQEVKNQINNKAHARLEKNSRLHEGELLQANGNVIHGWMAGADMEAQLEQAMPDGLSSFFSSPQCDHPYPLHHELTEFVSSSHPPQACR
jgi:hypothetical protein